MAAPEAVRLAVGGALCPAQGRRDVLGQSLEGLTLLTRPAVGGPGHGRAHGSRRRSAREAFRKTAKKSSEILKHVSSFYVQSTCSDVVRVPKALQIPKRRGAVLCVAAEAPPLFSRQDFFFFFLVKKRGLGVVEKLCLVRFTVCAWCTQ